MIQHFEGQEVRLLNELNASEAKFLALRKDLPDPTFLNVDVMLVLPRVVKSWPGNLMTLNPGKSK